MTKNTLWPVGDTFVPFADYITAKIKSLKKEIKGLKDLDADHIKQFKKLRSEGAEDLTDEAPDPFKQAFASFLADATKAEENDKVLEAKAEEEAKLKAEQDAKFAEHERELVAFAEKVDYKEIAANFDTLFEQGDAGDCLIPKTDVMDTELIGALAYTLNRQSATQFQIGDAVNLLRQRGFDNVVVNVCAMYKREYPTISNYAKTAEVFPPDKRRGATVPFTIFQEIACAKLPIDDAKKLDTAREKLLKKAEKDNLSAQELRPHIREAQGKATAPTPPPAKNWLVVDLATGTVTAYLDEQPYEDGKLQINAAKRLYLGVEKDEEGKEKLDWLEIPAA